MVSRTVEGYLYEEFIFCHCGCGKTRPKYSKHTRKNLVAKFISGHNFIGHKKLSEEHKRKIGLAQIGEKNHMYGRIKETNPNWSGDNVSYSQLHRFVRKYNPPPEKCQMCLKVPPEELANITGIYNREFKNWAWFCVSCHLKFDNIIERNLLRKKKKIK